MFFLGKRSPKGRSARAPKIGGQYTLAKRDEAPRGSFGDFAPILEITWRRDGGTLVGSAFWPSTSKELFPVGITLRRKLSSTLGGALNEIEGVLIAAAEPPFNRQGARFRGVSKFGQVANAKAEDVSIKSVRDMLTGLIETVAEDLPRKIEKKITHAIRELKD